MSAKLISLIPQIACIRPAQIFKDARKKRPILLVTDELYDTGWISTDYLSLRLQIAEPQVSDLMSQIASAGCAKRKQLLGFFAFSWGVGPPLIKTKFSVIKF